MGACARMHARSISDARAESPEELAEVYSPGQYVPRRLEFPETRVEMREVSAGEKLCAGIDGMSCCALIMT